MPAYKNDLHPALLLCLSHGAPLKCNPTQLSHPMPPMHACSTRAISAPMKCIYPETVADILHFLKLYIGITFICDFTA